MRGVVLLMLLLFLVLLQGREAIGSDSIKNQTPASKARAFAADEPADAAEPLGGAAQRDAVDQAESRVAAVVDGAILYHWQVEALLEYNIKPTRQEAIEYWIETQLKAREARRLELEQKRKSQFILDFIEDTSLSFMLSHHLAYQVGEPAANEAYHLYQHRVNEFHRDLIANVQIIEVASIDIAEMIITEARKPGGDFVRLHEKYDVNKDERKGETGNVSGEQLEELLGPPAISILRQASAGDILGPFAFESGYAVVRVIHVSPGTSIPFSQVQSRLLEDLRRTRVQDYLSRYMASLRENARIERNPASAGSSPPADRLEKRRSIESNRENSPVETDSGHSVFQGK